MRVWQNKGFGGGRKVKESEVTIYSNAELNQVSDDGRSLQDAKGIIFDPKKEPICKPLDRPHLHLADWDGDRYCDIMWVDPDNENRVHLWRNRRSETGKWDWVYNFNPAPDRRYPEKRGVGIFDLPVRFADISCTGRADYIRIEKDERDIGGSRYEWQPVDHVYQGSQAGSCVYYPDLDGDGRAEMRGIKYSIDNTAYTWFNPCTGDGPGDGGDGDGSEKNGAFDKLKEHCSSVGCSGGDTLKANTKIVTKQRLQEVKITISAEGYFSGEGHRTLENTVDLANAISQAEGAHEVKQQKYEEGCGAPFRNTGEANQYYTTTTVHGSRSSLGQQDDFCGSRY
ncbi:hypothetical protein DL769_004087 [Monosporascus sp. CRB-8-3]|nr:hypothetical protein DL769_004087 [Monosporascus sp. CRB-8-3]